MCSNVSSDVILPENQTFPKNTSLKIYDLGNDETEQKGEESDFRLHVSAV